MPNIGPMELIVVLVIALVVLGPKRLPDAGKSIGKGMREFKDAISGGGDKKDEQHTLATAAPAEPTHV
ncbi:MAG: twin-arginine translocase TatA/TatE family subunit [Solirubrobacteraceae bacterium]